MFKPRQLINEDDSSTIVSHKIIKFEPALTLSQDQKSEANAKLRAEVQALRLELAKAQRRIAQYETLMSNALIREHEIRSAMVQRTQNFSDKNETQAKKKG
jgi:hypothetical protein